MPESVTSVQSNNVCVQNLDTGDRHRAVDEYQHRVATDLGFLQHSLLAVCVRAVWLLAIPGDGLGYDAAHDNRRKLI